MPLYAGSVTAAPPAAIAEFLRKDLLFIRLGFNIK
jgi:hypothetical protein